MGSNNRALLYSAATAHAVAAEYHHSAVSGILTHSSHNGTAL